MRRDAIGDFSPYDERRGSQQNPECKLVYDELTMVKKRKVGWFGHILRSFGMAKTVLQGTVKAARRRGRPKKRREDNIKELTGMEFGDSLRAAEDREGWQSIVVTSSVLPRRPSRFRDQIGRLLSAYFGDVLYADRRGGGGAIK